MEAPGRGGRRRPIGAVGANAVDVVDRKELAAKEASEMDKQAKT